MRVYINGEWSTAGTATVSAFDRSFQYGDGAFDTIPFFNHQCFRQQDHLDRLKQTCEYLDIIPGVSWYRVRLACEELAASHQGSHGVVRLHISRGVGPRGYSPAGCKNPTVVAAAHSTDLRLPPTLEARTLTIATERLFSGTRLNRWKTANKLTQVLARGEAIRRGYDEAILLNERGECAEATSANLFLWLEDQLVTPPLTAGCMDGITRRLILNLAQELGMRVAERTILPEHLKEAKGGFLSLSTLGLLEIANVDGLSIPAHPATLRLHKQYWQLVALECPLPVPEEATATLLV